MTETAPTLQAMPPRAPLQMDAQDFARAPLRRAAPQRRSSGWRLAVFGPALIGTALTAATAQKRRDAVLGAQILDLSADLSKQSSYAARLASDNARLSDRCQDQDATITALSNELDTVYGSKSWRATGPLRSLMARLKTNESP